MSQKHPRSMPLYGQSSQIYGGTEDGLSLSAIVFDTVLQFATHSL
jgi:hypothetical protein